MFLLQVAIDPFARLRKMAQFGPDELDEDDVELAEPEAPPSPQEAPRPADMGDVNEYVQDLDRPKDPLAKLRIMAQVPPHRARPTAAESAETDQVIGAAPEGYEGPEGEIAPAELDTSAGGRTDRTLGGLARGIGDVTPVIGELMDRYGNQGQGGVLPESPMARRRRLEARARAGTIDAESHEELEATIRGDNTAGNVGQMIGEFLGPGAMVPFHGGTRLGARALETAARRGIPGARTIARAADPHVRSATGRLIEEAARRGVPGARTAARVAEGPVGAFTRRRGAEAVQGAVEFGPGALAHETVHTLGTEGRLPTPGEAAVSTVGGAAGGAVLKPVIGAVGEGARPIAEWMSDRQAARILGVKLNDPEEAARRAAMDRFMDARRRANEAARGRSEHKPPDSSDPHWQRQYERELEFFDEAARKARNDAELTAYAYDRLARRHGWQPRGSPSPESEIPGPRPPESPPDPSRALTGEAPPAAAGPAARPQPPAPEAPPMRPPVRPAAEAPPARTGADVSLPEGEARPVVSPEEMGAAPAAEGPAPLEGPTPAGQGGLSEEQLAEVERRVAELLEIEDTNEFYDARDAIPEDDPLRDPIVGRASIRRPSPVYVASTVRELSRMGPEKAAREWKRIQEEEPLLARELRRTRDFTEPVEPAPPAEMPTPGEAEGIEGPESTTAGLTAEQEELAHELSGLRGNAYESRLGELRDELGFDVAEAIQSRSSEIIKSSPEFQARLRELEAARDERQRQEAEVEREASAQGGLFSQEPEPPVEGGLEGPSADVEAPQPPPEYAPAVWRYHYDRLIEEGNTPERAAELASDELDMGVEPGEPAGLEGPESSLEEIPAEDKAEFVDKFWEWWNETPFDLRMADEELDWLNCTSCAAVAQRVFGGKLMGYGGDENLSARVGRVQAGDDSELRPGGGHDFLVVDDRYIIDPWAVNEGYEPILDMQAEPEKARELYGDQAEWEAVPEDFEPIPHPNPEFQAEQAEKIRSGLEGPTPQEPDTDPAQADLMGGEEAPAAPEMDEAAVRAQLEDLAIDGVVTRDASGAFRLTMRAGDVYRDPETFQFKRTTEDGIQRALHGDYDQFLGGTMDGVWVPARPGVFIVNGHHRHKKALEEGEDTPVSMRVYMVSPERGRYMGALMNIAEGNATATDAAKFLREEGLTEEELSEANIDLRKDVTRLGVQLAKLPDDIFTRVATGDLTERIGAAIGESGLSEAGMRALADLVRNQPDLTLGQIREHARFVAGAGETTESQETLFGTEELTRSNALEKAQLSARIRRRLSRDKNLFRYVARPGRASRLEESEAGEINVEQASELANQAASLEEAYEKLSVMTGPVSDALNAAAQELAAGGKESEIVDRLYGEVEEAIRSDPDIRRLLGGQDEIVSDVEPPMWEGEPGDVQGELDRLADERERDGLTAREQADQYAAELEPSTEGIDLSAIEALGREGFVGEPTITMDDNANQLKPTFFQSAREAEPEPFMGGKFEIYRGGDVRPGAGSTVILPGEGRFPRRVASYDGDTLVVDPEFRNQGVATELVMDFRVRNPDVPPAEYRTRGAQATQERAWERLNAEIEARKARELEGPEGRGKHAARIERVTDGVDLAPIARMTREEFIGEPFMTPEDNAKRLTPTFYKSARQVEPEPFMGGEFLIFRGAEAPRPARDPERSWLDYEEVEDIPHGSTVTTNDEARRPIASYDGELLAVEPWYRGRGIATELVMDFRSRNPDIEPAEARTPTAQHVQEEAWRRLQGEAKARGLEGPEGESDVLMDDQPDMFGADLRGPQEDLGLGGGRRREAEPSGRGSLGESERIALETVERLRPVIEAREATPEQREELRQALALLNRNDALSADEARLLSQADTPPDTESGDLFGDLEGPEPELPMDMLRTGENTVGAGLDPSVVRKMGANMYKGDLTQAALKEGLQNSVDSMPKEGGGNIKIEVRTGTDERFFSIVDDGHGMSPDVAANEFMDIGGSTKGDDPDARGKFGFAKVALLAHSENFRLVTTDLDGNTTRIEGSAEDWVDGTLTFEVETGGVSRYDVEGKEIWEPQPRSPGTALRVKFEEDARLHWSLGLDHVERHLKWDQSGNTLTVTRDGEPYPTEIFGYQDPPFEQVGQTEVFDVPGAKLEIRRGQDRTETTRTQLVYLNRGLYQFDKTHFWDGDPGIYPKEILIDVRANVPTENMDYPWTTNREDVKEQVKLRVGRYLADIKFAELVRQVDVLLDALRNPGKIPNSGGLGVHATSGTVSKELIDYIASRPWAPALSTKMMDAAVAIYMQIQQVPRYKHIPKFEFGGFGITKSYVGVNIRRRDLEGARLKAGIGDPMPDENLILINPYGYLYEMKSWNETPTAELLAKQTWGTIFHEVTHQLERGHNKEFVGVWTRIDAHVNEIQEQWVAELTKVWQQALDGGILDDLPRVTDEWEGDNLFESISDHSGSSDAGGADAPLQPREVEGDDRVRREGRVPDAGDIRAPAGEGQDPRRQRAPVQGADEARSLEGPGRGSDAGAARGAARGLEGPGGGVDSPVSLEKGAIGLVPDQYRPDMAFQTSMTPRQFLDIAAPKVGGVHSSRREFFTEAIESGKPIGAPFIEVRVRTTSGLTGLDALRSGEPLEFQAVQHEGRSRAEVLDEVLGDAEIPVSILFRDRVRVSDFSPDQLDQLRNAEIMPETRGRDEPYPYVKPESQPTARFRPGGEDSGQVREQTEMGLDDVPQPRRGREAWPADERPPTELERRLEELMEVDSPTREQWDEMVRLNDQLTSKALTPTLKGPISVPGKGLVDSETGEVIQEFKPKEPRDSAIETNVGFGEGDPRQERLDELLATDNPTPEQVAELSKLADELSDQVTFGSPEAEAEAEARIAEENEQHNAEYMLGEEWAAEENAALLDNLDPAAREAMILERDREIEKNLMIDLAGTVVRTAADIAQLMSLFRSPARENVMIGYYKSNPDGSYTLLDYQVHTSGLLNAAEMNSIRTLGRIILTAQRLGADAVSAAHNHPSGKHIRSKNDVRSHKSLGENLHNFGAGLKLIDSIVTDDGLAWSIGAELAGENPHYLYDSGAAGSWASPYQGSKTQDAIVQMAGHLADKGGFSSVWLGADGNPISFAPHQSGDLSMFEDPIAFNTRMKKLGAQRVILAVDARTPGAEVLYERAVRMQNEKKLGWYWNEGSGYSQGLFEVVLVDGPKVVRSALKNDELHFYGRNVQDVESQFLRDSEDTIPFEGESEAVARSRAENEAAGGGGGEKGPPPEDSAPGLEGPEGEGEGERGRMGERPLDFAGVTDRLYSADDFLRLRLGETRLDKATERLFRAEYERVVKAMGARRRKVTAEDVSSMAWALGQDPVSLADILNRRGLDGAEQLALLATARSNTVRMGEALEILRSGKMPDGSELDKGKRVELESEVDRRANLNNILLTKWSKEGSEAGRTLWARQLEAFSIENETAVLGLAQRLKERSGGTRELTREEQESVLAAVRSKNPDWIAQQLQAFDRQSPISKIFAIIKASMLSLLQTQMVNLTSNSIKHVVLPVERFYAQLADRGLARVRQRITGEEYARTTLMGRPDWEGEKALLFESPRKATEAYGYALTGRIPEGRGKEAITALQRATRHRTDVRRRVDFVDPKKRTFSKNKGLVSKAILPARYGLEIYTNGVLGALGAGDVFFRHPAYVRSLWEQAMIKARREGLEKGTPEYNDRVNQLVEDPTPAMERQAEDDSNESVFMDATGLFLGVDQIIQNVKRGEKLGIVGQASAEFVFPFTRTLLGIADQTTDLTGVGMIRGTINASKLVKLLVEEANRPDKQLALESGEIQTALSPHDPQDAAKIAQIDAAQKHAAKQLGRGGLGATAFLLLMGLGGYLAFRDKIKTRYPRDNRERELWRAQDIRPNSILINGKWRQTDFLGPYGLALMIGAYQHDVLNAEDDEERDDAIAEGIRTITQLSEQMMRVIGAITIAQGLETVSEISGGETGSLEKFAHKIGRMPYPNILRGVTRWMDPVRREADYQDVGQQWKVSTPGMSQDFPPRVDAFGNDIVGPEGFWANMASPSRGARPDKTLTDERLRVVSDLGTMPLRPDRKDVEGWAESAGFELDPWDWYDIQKFYGGEMAAITDVMRNDPDWQALPDVDKRESLENAWANAKRSINGALRTQFDRIGEQLAAEPETTGVPTLEGPRPAVGVQ